MVCGNDAYARNPHHGGCGKIFNWQQAPMYKPKLQDESERKKIEMVLPEKVNNILWN